MRCLSVAAVALLSTALSASGTQQTKTRTPAPPSGQPSHQDLTSSVPSGADRAPAQQHSKTPIPHTAKPSLLTGSAAPTPVAKPPIRTDGPSNHSFVSGGSDTCATATAIGGNGPFFGDNNGANTDGPSNCGLMAADVWYNWTAPASGLTNFSLCGSGYDTVISVYDTAACTGTLLACDDDSSCGLQSQVNVNVTAGNVYKVQVGGFNGSTGSYQLQMSLAPTCPCSGNPPEGEAGCGIPTDTFNGGCNSSPPVYSPIACGGTVCGTAAWNGSFRDTDWYQFTLATTQSVTWTVTAEFAVVTGILDNNCPPNILDFDFGPACTATSSTANLAAGTYIAFTAPDFGGPTFPCSGSNTYAGALTCGASCAPPEDACASALPISGLGPFTGSTSCASTDGPDPCGVLMSNDVWYDWTCGASGITTFSLCGSGYDTSIAVYDTNACVGTVLACNDDFCNFQSQTQANVTAGNVYKIQVGGFANATGSYTLSISAPLPPCPCSGNPPEGEAGCGVPTDTFNGGCNSTPPVYSPIACGGSVCGTAAWNGSVRDTDWYQFTVATNTTVTWTVTAEFPVVTGILDNNCPPSILDFDFGGTCVATSSTAALFPGTYIAFTAPDFGGPPFACTTGNTYTGVLACQGTQPPGPCDSYDDGSAETAVGFGTPATDILWMHREGAAGNSAVVFSISTAYGSAAIPGNGPANGDPARVGIWQDSDNDGDPTTGLVLLQVVNTTVANVDTDILNVVPLSPPVVVTGTYFIGADTDGSFPSPLDQSVAGGGRSWIAGNNTGPGTINYNNLNGEPVPPLNEDGIAPGVWLLRADCAAKGTIEGYCSPDGVNFNCPCGNGAPGAGCANSDHTGGALLTATGTASLSGDTLSMSSTQAGTVGHHSSSLAVIFQGHDAGTFIAYGDGARCIANPLKRLFKFTPASAVTLTAPSAQSIPNQPFSTRSAAVGDPLSAGDVRGYQLLYRDPVAFCTPQTFNASNGVRVVWAP